MRTYATLFDELDMMKMQMQVLMRHIDCQPTISETMIRKACQKTVREFCPTKAMMAAAVIVSGLFLPALFWTMSLTDILPDRCSIPFALFVHVMGWYSLYRGWQFYRTSYADTFANGTIVEVAAQIAEIRQKNSLHRLVTGIFFVVFVIWYLIDNGTLLLANMDHCIIVTLVFGIVGYSLAVRFSRIHHFTNDILGQIEELKQ